MSYTYITVSIMVFNNEFTTGKKPPVRLTIFENGSLALRLLLGNKF